MFQLNTVIAWYIILWTNEIWHKNILLLFSSRAYLLHSSHIFLLYCMSHPPFLLLGVFSITNKHCSSQICEMIMLATLLKNEVTCFCECVITPIHRMLTYIIPMYLPIQCITWYTLICTTESTQIAKYLSTRDKFIFYYYRWNGQHRSISTPSVSKYKMC
jgi:hypothetical protein